MLQRCTAYLSLVLACLSAPLPVLAQEYPTRPVTILVGLSAGGVSDVMARIYAEAVAERLGQRVIVENRPAASGAVAASRLQSAEPDGYTLLIFSGAQHATVPALGTSATYDPVKGAQPITLLFNISTVLAVPATVAANSLADLAAFAAKRPDGLIVGSPGVGTPSHLTAAKLMVAAKIPARYVHYRGGAPMMQDLVPGRVEAAVLSTSLAKSFLIEKKIRAIAIDAPARWLVIPDIPTLRELGLGDATVAGWFGVAAPPETPPAIVAKLHNAFTAAAQDPAVKRRVEALGLTLTTSTPQEMGKLMAKEAVDIAALVRSLGIQNK